MMTSNSLDALSPLTRIVAENAIDEARDNGFSIKVLSTKRDGEFQNYLYSIGRTRPGKVVTNAQSGESYHQYGDAFDIEILKNGIPSNDRKDYEKFSIIAKKRGLYWGGDFKSIDDYGHFERKNKEVDKKILEAININSKNKNENSIIPIAVIAIFLIIKFFKG